MTARSTIHPPTNAASGAHAARRDVAGSARRDVDGHDGAAARNAPRRGATHTAESAATTLDGGSVADAPDRSSNARTASPPARRTWLFLLLLAVGTFVVFAPALSGQWLRWDDDRNFLDHDAWRGLSPSHLGWMFTTFHQGPYQPLSWVTLAIDHALWGMDPFGFHLTNVILHAATAVVFFLLARRLLDCARRRALEATSSAPSLASPLASPRAGADAWLDWGAFVAAAVFAWHPLRCESVAWITERRDVLSGLLLVGCVNLYVRSRTDEGARGRDGVVSVALYAASLLAKGLGMTLPVVLLVLDVFVLARWNGTFVGAGSTRERDRRGPRSLVGLTKEKWAYLVLAVAAAAAAWYGQRHHASVVDWDSHTLSERVGQSFYGLAYYATKTVWPTDLSPLSPLPLSIDPLAMPYLGAAIGMIAAFAAAFAFRRRAPALLAAGLAYAVFASPVLGLTQAGPQIVADRYSYLPCTALALLAGAAFVTAGARFGPRGASAAAWAVPALSALAPASALAVATHRQCHVWHDTVSIWEQACRVTPDHPDMRRNLSVALMRAAEATEDPARKIEFYRRGLKECREGAARRADSGLFSNEAVILKALADLEPEKRAEHVAAAHARALDAIHIGEAMNEPIPDAYVNHALLSIEMGRAPEALPSLAWLYERDPASAEYALMLGQTLALVGRPREALAPLERAQRLDPRTPVPWMEAGNAHKALGQNADARRCFARGIETARRLPPEAGVTPEMLAEWQRWLDELPP